VAVVVEAADGEVEVGGTAADGVLVPPAEGAAAAGEEPGPRPAPELAVDPVPDGVVDDLMV
jgi:hypothetical protein